MTSTSCRVTESIQIWTLNLLSAAAFVNVNLLVNTGKMSINAAVEAVIAAVMATMLGNP